MLEATTTLAPEDSFFDSLNPLEWFGLENAPSSGIPGIARSVGPGGHVQTAPLWSPQNPLFVFGALLALTTGLVAFSTSFGVRAGRQRANVNLNVGKA